MAPRTAKAKKAADVKVADSEAPKKSRGKAKHIEEVEQEVPDVDVDEKSAPIADKKTKRGKKANDTNGILTNGQEIAPPAKRGRKKAAEEPIREEKGSDGENSADEANVAEEVNGKIAEEPEIEEEAPATTGRGRKKQPKKEEKAEAKPAGRGKKGKLDDGDSEDKEVEEKPKSKGRGRKAQSKPETEEPEDKTEMDEEVVKPDPPAKGRKKGAKAAKEKTPDTDKEDAPEEDEDKLAEEPKKKEPKGRKGQKKAQAKEEDEDNVEEVKEEPASKKRKVNKKEDKGDSKDEEVEDEGADAKPAKGKKGQKKPVETQANAQDEVDPEDEPQDTGEPTTKRRRKPADDKAPEDAKKKAPLKNKSSTNYEDIDFSNSSKNSQGKDWNFKIASWNVDGIRAWMAKGGLDYVKYEKPDILCLQEVKCSKDKLPDEAANLPGYHAYWLCSDKDGYAGVGIYTTKLAMNVQYGLQNEELDNEGRIITAEYEQFYLICTYVPNAGRGLVSLPKRLQWNEEFRKYVKELDKKKPVIICGDMNVSHNEIDLANPKTNKKNAGFTAEERAGMTDLLGDGFIDTYRHLNPEKTGAYTFWTYMKNSRSKNVGWRLDYFIVSERLLPCICDNVIRSEVYGSDHCPISLFLQLTSADKPKEE